MLAYAAFRRQDVPLGVLAWLLFVPYLSFYSLFIPLAMFAIRTPRTALIFTILLWIIFGGTMVFLIGRSMYYGLV
jgi:hypothetical protein